ncbi:uncharacterized protein [Procambarus clarkii]|uniref:uncharacterized protein n=1 Tax=Procambarus clarkii TaxID=6728 RepID=UPI003742C03E
MPLQSWASNNQQLNQIIEKEFSDYYVPNKLKIPGMEWDTSTDELNVNGQWPKQKPQAVVTNITTPTVDPEHPRSLAINPHSYSSLDKLLRVTEIVFDFLNKVGIKYRFPRRIKYWVKRAQQQTYGRKYGHLPDKLSKSLGLWYDSNNHNIFRCGGRLLHADIDLEIKNPIFLPRHHIITKFIVLHYHQHNTLHGGVLDTLTDLRQRFWPPQGCQAVKSLIKSCVVCRRYDARVCPYPGPPPLLKERVVHLHSIETTGVDYTGALILNGSPDKIPVKAYISLFTCTTIRGVHLEVTSDMCGEAFLQAFCRFAARRYCPKLMISDNGSYFLAGQACLREIWNRPEMRYPADPSCISRSDLVESYKHLSRVIEKRNEVWTREYLTALERMPLWSCEPLQ